MRARKNYKGIFVSLIFVVGTAAQKGMALKPEESVKNRGENLEMRSDGRGLLPDIPNGMPPPSPMMDEGMPIPSKMEGMPPPSLNDRKFPPFPPSSPTLKEDPGIRRNRNTPKPKAGRA